jgi:hypothetical protein
MPPSDDGRPARLRGASAVVDSNCGTDADGILLTKPKVPAPCNEFRGESSGFAILRPPRDWERLRSPSIVTGGSGAFKANRAAEDE